MNESKKIFVLDTNVLLHDSSSIFRFQEHDVYLPLKVLEEIDKLKVGLTDVARNSRQVSRILDCIIKDATYKDIEEGLLLNKNYSSNDKLNGRLFFQTKTNTESLPTSLPGSTADNDILSFVLSLKAAKPERNITLVSKDINLRIKASILDIHTEDYYNDKTISDVNELYIGFEQLPHDFWTNHAKKLESWKDGEKIFYRVCGQDVKNWFINEGLLSFKEESPVFLVREIKNDTAVLEVAKDYTSSKNKLWGINAKNKEQNLALNLLMDQNIDFVTLLGAAGTGKTILTLAAGLSQVLDYKKYNEIILTRVTISVGEDIGFLPGSEEEKMSPWFGSLLDNLEVLLPKDQNDFGKMATTDLMNNKIKIKSLNFMRGRSFQNKFVIIDEAQNLTSKQMKTLISRSGNGTKIVCLGDLSQIDSPYLSSTTSGLTYAVDRMKNYEFGGHLTLIRGERSRLADFASENL